ncbi:dipeptidase [Muriicola sp. Z0-33]|uniref:dipeptidase n=1 Tax=Muriicola sp. Z0-33 TaxID=2816957 RepID=UPI002236FBCE|nr:dipeptidase [Muriicola sp. Z0-33]MCW5515244.1 membrane dipeptidase [Muriicola sp. Z0-33]
MHFNNEYVDLHCHPSLKPFGKSFNYSPKGINHPHRSTLRSIWHYDPPTLLDKLINYIGGLTKFRQSNFTSLALGGVSIVCVSLYPMEKWFVRNKINNELIADLLANFALGVGDKRIDFIQGIKDYFKDLEMQYDFFRQLDGKIIRLNQGLFKYRLVKNYSQIEEITAKDDENGNIKTIFVVLSIEGLHVLNTGLKKPLDEVEILANLEKIKNWDHRPFMITLAHHFYNDICGHAESLSGIVKKKTDQSEGLGTGFTPLGIKVLTRLVDNTDGKRILADIKHMSAKARKEYYTMLDSHQQEFQDIPVVVSHGACNGLKSSSNRIPGNSAVATKLNPVDINFFDDEVIRIAKSKGIIGLQLDERRIASKQTIKDTKKSVKRNKIMHYRSELLWNQIQHIIEILDDENLFAWDCMALGTDFDGIIDPLNGFWTAEELPYLADFLERHVYNYMKNHNLSKPENIIPADEIVSRIMSSNGKAFLKNNFK